jgi:serine/threonine-protein kinase
VPYQADNPMSVLYQHLEGVKIAPSKRNTEISPALEAIIEKAMAVKPEDRYQSAAEMLDAVERVMVREVAAA